MYGSTWFGSTQRTRSTWTGMLYFRGFQLSSSDRIGPTDRWRTEPSRRSDRGTWLRNPRTGPTRTRAELVRMSGDSGIGSGVLMLEWRSPGEEGIVGVADLTCVRSAVRHLVSFVHPVAQLRWFGHVSGLAILGGKALYRAIRIDPPVDQYVDRPLLGGTVEIDRRRSISIGITEGGRKKKREKPGSPARSVARRRFLLPDLLDMFRSIYHGKTK
ncbi:hypothetical protein GW17_00001250 [Ensete ventricosum]|nr:hypothetical protein GW17_00001250 [Ensete ventricosum]